MGGQRVRRCTIGATVSHPLNRTKRIFHAFRLCVEIGLDRAGPGDAAHGNGRGKCDRLVATGAADNPPFLWRDPQNPKRLIGANADLLGQIADSLGLKLDLLLHGRSSEGARRGTQRSGRCAGRCDLSVQRLEELDFVHPAIIQLQTAAWVRNEPGFFYASGRT